MNMISTGTFLNEMDASDKQETLAEKFARVWEKKNSKAARAGGVSLMALSLAACGSDSDPVVEPEEEEEVVVNPVTKELGTGLDSISADELTSAGDTITATSSTLAATDSVSDGFAGDGDTMNITLTAGNAAASIDNIETVSFDWNAFGTAAIDLTAVSGAETINITSSKVGFLGSATITATGTNNVVAGSGITGTVTANGATTGSVITADNASTVAAAASTAAGPHSTTVNAATATTVTVTDFASATVNAPAATAITVDDSGVTTASTTVNIDAATNVTFTNTNAVGSVTVATAGDDATIATVNNIGKDLTIAGEGDFTLNSTATGEVINNDKTSGELTVKNTVTTALDLDEVSADLIWLTGIKTAADTVASGANLKYSGAGTDVRVTVAGAGTADTATATVTSATVDDMVITGVETMTVVADAPSISGADLTVTTLDTNGNKIVVTGTNDVTFSTIDESQANGTAAGTVDASGLSGNLVVSATQADENLTLVGSSGNNTITLSGTSSTQSFTGFAGDDTVTSSVQGGSKTLVMGDGDNTVTAAGIVAGDIVVNSGAGEDTVTIGASGNMTDANINLSTGAADDTITITADEGTLDAATITVNAGAGDDTIAITGVASNFTNTANTTLSIDGGDGDDTLSLGTAAGTLDIDWSLGTVSISNIETIVLNSNEGNNTNANFQAADISGQAITFQADGAGDGFTVTGAATGGTIDLSTLTIDQSLTKAVVGVTIDASAAAAAAVTITGTAIADTITGGGLADTITAGNGADTITGGNGSDTIDITEAASSTAIDNVVLAAAGNGVDTIIGFDADVDTVTLSNASELATGGGAVMASSGATIVAGAAAFDISDVDTEAADIIEISATLSSNGDLDAATNGTELLKALSSTTTASTGIQVRDADDDAADVSIVAYQDGNAYIYFLDAQDDAAATGADLVVAAANITLVGIIEGVTAGTLVADDFVAL